MSEKRDPNVDLTTLRLKLENIRLKVEFGAKDIVHDTKFNTIVSKEKREEASLMAEAFAGEAMTFLRENLTGKLIPVKPTKAQLSIFGFLMDSVYDKNLVLDETKGRVTTSGRPYLVKHYSAKESYLGDDIVESAISFYRDKEVHLTVRWGTDDFFPHGFAVMGRIGMKQPRSINFMTFPEKIKTPDDAQKYLQYPDEVKGFTYKIGVYGKGNRIDINYEGTYKGDEVSMTEQYFLIGSYFGEGTGREYWLYGNNGEAQTKMTVQQKQTTKEMVPQRISNQ